MRLQTVYIYSLRCFEENPRVEQQDVNNGANVLPLAEKSLNVNTILSEVQIIYSLRLSGHCANGVNYSAPRHLWKWS